MGKKDKDKKKDKSSKDVGRPASKSAPEKKDKGRKKTSSSPRDKVGEPKTVEKGPVRVGSAAAGSNGMDHLRPSPTSPVVKPVARTESAPVVPSRSAVEDQLVPQSLPIAPTPAVQPAQQQHSSGGTSPNVQIQATPGAQQPVVNFHQNSSSESQVQQPASPPQQFPVAPGPPGSNMQFVYIRNALGQVVQIALPATLLAQQVQAAALQAQQQLFRSAQQQMQQQQMANSPAPVPVQPQQPQAQNGNYYYPSSAPVYQPGAGGLPQQPKSAPAAAPEPSPRSEPQLVIDPTPVPAPRPVPVAVPSPVPSSNGLDLPEQRRARSPSGADRKHKHHHSDAKSKDRKDRKDKKDRAPKEKSSSAPNDLVALEPDLLTERATDLLGDFVIKRNQLELVRVLGEGAFGQVYFGKYLGTEVAIKKLKMLNPTPEAQDDFMHELALMRTLRHPNVVLYMGVCVQPPPMCIVTEYCKFGSLDDVLHKRKEALSREAMLTILDGTARGMAYLHNKQPKIIHRDLKSANLLVSDNYQIKIADFGVSRMKYSGGTQQTQTTVGSPLWMAPEVIRGESYAEKCDVYSFAIVMWELFERKLPYHGLDAFQIMYRVGTQHSRPGISKETLQKFPKHVQLMKRCWQDRADDRPGFADIITELSKNR